MSKIGYVRVSTDDQDTIRQDLMMKEQKVEKVFREKISGKNAERPELQKMMDYIRQGDTVVVESISRLARNTRDLLELVDRFKSKGVEFVSLKETIDTHTPAGQFMLTVFGAMAQLERDYILSRQKEGIEAHKKEDQERKKQGLEPLTYKGRKRIQYDPDRFKIEVELVEQGKQTHETAAKNLGFIDQDGKLKMRTYFRRVKELKEQEEPKKQTIIVNGKCNPPEIDPSKMKPLELVKHEKPEQTREMKPLKITKN